MKLRKQSDDATPEFNKLVEEESLMLAATEAICDLMEKRSISRADLSRRINKSRGFVTQILSGERNMTLRTLSDLAFALDARIKLGWGDLSERELAPPEVQWESFEDSVAVTKAIDRAITSGFELGARHIRDVVPFYARHKAETALKGRSFIYREVEEAEMTPDPEGAAA